MKYILPLCSLLLPSTLRAQFIVGSSGITIESGAVLTVDGLVIQPSAALNIQNNQLQLSTATAVIGSGNSIERVYEFAMPIVYSGRIGFSYRDTELAGNVENSLNLYFASAATGNIWMSGTGTDLNTSTNNISATVINSSIARVTASGAVPLPVILISFDAQKDISGQAALLSWQVAQEKNLDRYIVERSTDAKVFGSLGFVPVAGKATYGFTDTKPLTGKNSYRLKIVDHDGSFTYSEVRVLNFENRHGAFRVYPNPVKGEVVTITNDDIRNRQIQVTVTDISGKIIRTFLLDGAQTQMDVSGWTPGTYIISIDNHSPFKLIRQ